MRKKIAFFIALIASVILFSSMSPIDLNEEIMVETDYPVMVQNDLKVKFKKKEYGLTRSNVVYSYADDDAPMGYSNIIENVEVTKKTKKVPARLGSQFGVGFEAQSTVNGLIEIEEVWIFPEPMINKDGKSFKENRSRNQYYTNTFLFAGYTFEEELEIIKGTWTYQVYYNGEKVLEQKFHVEGTDEKPIVKANQDVKFEIVNYGIYNSDVVYTTRNYNAAVGYSNVVDNVKFIKKTTDVKAMLGSEFGMEYIIKSDTKDAVDVETVWIFPAEMVNEQGEHFRELRSRRQMYTNTKGFTGYSFEKKYEIVKGTWTFQIFYKGKKMLEQKFHVK